MIEKRMHLFQNSKHTSRERTRRRKPGQSEKKQELLIKKCVSVRKKKSDDNSQLLSVFKFNMLLEGQIKQIYE